MIQRDLYDMLRKEYDWSMTKLKKVQKENELLRNQIEMVERESEYWEFQAKEIEKRKLKVEAELKLWKGTAP